MRIFAPSTRMIRFTGEFDSPVKFVKYYKDEPRIVLKKDDVLILPAPMAMKVSRKHNFELVGFEEQAELLGQDDTEAEAKALEEAEKAKAEVTVTPEPTVTPEATVTPEPTVTPEVVITKENIMDESLVTLSMIKALCKQYNITIGRKKRDVLISLLLPYLG